MRGRERDGGTNLASTRLRARARARAPPRARKDDQPGGFPARRAIGAPGSPRKWRKEGILSTDILSWVAPITGVSAAIMVAINLGTRFTGWGFVVFTVSSVAW